MENQNYEHDIPGFEAESTPAKWIFIGRGPKREVWYTLKGSQEHPEKVFIPQNRFTGYLRKIEVTEQSFKGKVSKKLNLHFGVIKDCEEFRVVIRSGLESVFSRSVLLKLIEIDKDNLNKPITLVPYGSEQEEEVVFCSVQQFGKSIKAEWNKEASLIDLITIINDCLTSTFNSNPILKEEIPW